MKWDRVPPPKRVFTNRPVQKARYPPMLDPVIRRLNLNSLMRPLLRGEGSGRRTQTVWLATWRMARAAVQFAEGFKYLVDGNGRL
jgi:hypothetical protein